MGLRLSFKTSPQRVDWATLGHIGARARVVRGTSSMLKAVMFRSAS